MGCTNPFAPSFDENIGDDKPPISDQKDINGVFQNFQYSYTFKDTTIYGQLLTQDFIFTYRDYDQGFDVSWGRDDEMRTTLGLFQNVQRLDLVWNNIILLTQDSLTANVVRSFNLTIIFNPTDVIRVDGRVNLALRKNPESEKWQIARWLDESNF
ncbi:hypothetical protein [Ignavibacterium sp.]|uniref:hypothetical protein n=1 Tax=Ignavibacterium sp. TaxID=2651167 RepID=UPI00307F0C75